VPTMKSNEAFEREVDINSLDFFTGRKYTDPIVAREKGRCFYCLREINAQTCVLDHVKPQVVGIDNSYTNIVACCHECNSGKQGRGGEDFVRALYRRGLLVTAEFDKRLGKLGTSSQWQTSSPVLNLLSGFSQ